MSPGPTPAEERRLARINTCELLIVQRRLIGRHIGFSLCADPIWDMLLDLFIAEHRGRAISLTSLSGASNVPSTTALRAIKLLTSEGWLTRSGDPMDARRIHVTLTPVVRARIEQMLDDVGTMFAGAFSSENARR